MQPRKFVPRDPKVRSMQERIKNQLEKPPSFGYPSDNQPPSSNYAYNQPPSFDHPSYNQPRPNWMNPSGWKQAEDLGKRQESDPEQKRLREEQERQEQERQKQERLRREQERQRQERQERLRREQERQEQERQEQERQEQERLRREQISRNSEMSINDADRELLQKILLYFRTNSQNPELTQLSIEELKSLIYNNKTDLNRRIQDDKRIVRRFNAILHPDKLKENNLSKEFYSNIDEFYRMFEKKGGKKRTYRNKSNKKRKNTRSKKHLKKNKRKV
jgi:hypothetical protein